MFSWSLLDYDGNRQFAFFADDADANTVETIVFKCDVKVCANKNKEICSSSPQCSIDQCTNNECGNSNGVKRKRHALTLQTRQSSIEGTDLFELTKEISVPVISPENCKIMADTVCLEIQNKEITKPMENSALSLNTTKTIFALMMISMLNI